LLARLAEQEAQDQHIQSAQREKARADAAWMKKVNIACSLVTVKGVFFICRCYFLTELRLLLMEMEGLLLKSVPLTLLHMMHENPYCFLMLSLHIIYACLLYLSAR